MRIDFTDWKEDTDDKSYEISRDAFILNALPTFDYESSFVEFNEFNNIMSLAHHIADEDLDLYKSKDAVLKKYEQETPIECHVLDNRIIYRFFIEALGFSSDDGEACNYIVANYNFVDKWDARESDTLKILQMADIPDEGLDDDIIERLLSESTEM